MKKLFVTLMMAVMITANASAQGDSNWTLNTRAWTTNYFTSAIFSLVDQTIKSLAFKGNERDSLWGERLLPDPDLIFPIGMGKSGFVDNYNIYGPYHRAFSNPIKHIGDYAIGMDVSYKPSLVGFYAGAFFKSQEIVFKIDDTNLRAFYFQPRAGLIFGSLGGNDTSFESGVYYDVVTGCGGTLESKSKDMLKGGLGLDFALSTSDKSDKTKYILQFSMPLHNFVNPDFSIPNGISMKDMKRKVGYIMITQRIRL